MLSSPQVDRRKLHTSLPELTAGCDPSLAVDGSLSRREPPLYRAAVTQPDFKATQSPRSVHVARKSIDFSRRSPKTSCCQDCPASCAPLAALPTISCVIITLADDLMVNTIKFYQHHKNLSTAHDVD